MLLRYAFLLLNPDGTTNRVVAAFTDVPEFIHTNTSCAALQEKLHESIGWFIASSVRSSVTIVYHLPISPAIIK